MAWLASTVSDARRLREPAPYRRRSASWATIFALAALAPAAVPAAAALQEASPVYSITGPATGKFYVNPDGTAAQSLTHYWKVRKDGTAITATLPTWSVSAVSGTITMVISKGGAVSYQTMNSPTARVRVQAVYLGQTYEGFTDVTAYGLSTNPPPPPPPTQTCPDGSVIPATDTCPSPPPPTQTCPDGSVIPATETCPSPPPPDPTSPYSITGPATGKFYVNPDGTAAQSLTHYWKFRKDGVALSATLPTWSVAPVSGSITMVISKGGAVSYKTMTTPTARVRVRATYLGQNYDGFTDLTAYGLSTTPPPPPPPTQTCPDGSVIPATETCPPPPDPDPDPTPTGSTYFAAFGDIAPLSNGRAVANLTRSQGAEYLLMLGDNCYGTTLIGTQLDTNYSAEHAAGKIWPVMGNHDYEDACGGGSGGAAYYDYFVLPNNERYYDVVKGPVHLFAINSYKEVDGLTPTSVQGEWLRRKLAASTSPWNIVFFHHAPYSSGTSKGTVTMRWPFEAWGADAVLSGHDHVYERIMLDNDGDGTKIPYIISGLGGKSLSSFGTPTAGSVVRYAAAYGALFVRADATDMKLEFRNTSNVVVDSLTISKPPAANAFDFKTVPGK
jgi:hypothetical protein